MSEVTHRTVETNGIRMHIAEQGTGPLVILCHGFPESWYSWRHQLAALADAGFHAVAPDMRGYGGSDPPPEIDQYTLPPLLGDMGRLEGPPSRDGSVPAPPSRRRHGRSGGRARREVGGDRRPRLGRAGGMARSLATARPLSRGHRLEC